MTKDELSQLYWLNREIEKLDKKIYEIEAVIDGRAQVITDMPRGLGVDWTEKAADLADMKALAKLKREQAWYELKRLERYIYSIEDCQLRMIISLRYINGLTWQQVAFHIGESDEQYPRRKHNNFLKNASLKERK